MTDSPKLCLTLYLLPHRGRGHQQVLVPAAGGRAQFAPPEYLDIDRLEVEAKLIGDEPVDWTQIRSYEEREVLCDAIEEQGGFIRCGGPDGESIQIRDEIISGQELTSILFDLNGRLTRKIRELEGGEDAD